MKTTSVQRAPDGRHGHFGRMKRGNWKLREPTQLEAELSDAGTRKSIFQKLYVVELIDFLAF